MENLHCLCRLCLKSISNGRSSDLLNAETDGALTIADKLWKSLLISVNLNEKLPRKICLDCEIKINEIVNFKAKIERNQVFFDGYEVVTIPEEDNFEIEDEDLGDPLDLTDFQLNIEVMIKENVDDSCDSLKLEEFEDFKRELDDVKLEAELPVYGTSMVSQLKKYKWQCNVCGRGIKCERDLNQHIETHSINWHFCHCGKKFKNRLRFLHHKRTVHAPIKTNQRTFPCNEKGCNAFYMSRKELKRHDEKVHMQFYYKCTICHFRQSAKREVTRHIRKVHAGINRRPKLCQKGDPFDKE